MPLSSSSCGREPARISVTTVLRAAAALLLLLLLVLLVQAQPAGASPPAQAGVDGEKLFQSKCVGCHSIGRGKLVGPDLLDVSKRRDPQWLKSFIADPGKMFAANDPTAQQLLKENNNLRMPTLGLSAAEVDALVAYLASPGAGAGTGGTAGAAGATPGDPLAGRLVFMGALGPANGAPPCIACHSVAGTGALGGGALGPDLTHVAGRLGQPGLAAALGTIAFPTMIGPFTNRPLLPKEQADLVAFLVQADQQQLAAPPITAGAITGNTWTFLSIGLTGTVVLLAVMLFAWPRQRQSISARLRSGRPASRA